MTFTIYEYNSNLFLNYESEYATTLYDKFTNSERGDEYELVHKRFKVSKKELVRGEYPELPISSITFTIGFKKQDYYCIPNPIICNDYDVYINKEIPISDDIINRENFRKCFQILGMVLEGNIYIGFEDGQIHPDLLRIIVDRFPTYYEIQKYYAMRVNAIISTELEIEKDYNLEYEKYLKKRLEMHIDTPKEIEKHEHLFEANRFLNKIKKLKEMLENERMYSEKQWQSEILSIVRLLYPQYIYVTGETEIYSNEGGYRKKRRVDFVLLNSEGYLDIIEIKRPTVPVIAPRVVRDNYVPTKYVSDAVAQVENYLYILSRESKELEKILSKRFYKKELNENISVKILNPRGIIIMGNLEEEKPEVKKAFEIIRRQYSHIIDIYTYDDLVNRLEGIYDYLNKKFNSL